MNKLDKCIFWTSHIYNLLWILVMWCPYIFYYNQNGSITHMFNQLTWWCWSLQAVFYTYIHILTSPFYFRIRNYINNFHVIPTRLNNLLFYLPDRILIYGMVSGIVWFVFMYFCYVLFQNPDLIIKEMKKRDSYGGFIQIANILIHYYIVSSIFIWSLYMYNSLHQMMKTYGTTNFRKFKFSCSWLIYLLFYFCHVQTYDILRIKYLFLT